MSIDLHYMAMSPPCRAVQMTASAVGVELNLKPVNTMAKEHMTPEYLKLNPQHTIPTIQDGDLILWESRAIMGYLVNRYGKDDGYYPVDPVKRAIVDQRLYFDMGTLFARFSEYYLSQIFKKLPADPEKYKKLQEALGFFNTFLEGQKYAAGDELTIADFSLVTTVSTFVDGGANCSLDDYPNVQRWYKDCVENVPGYEETVIGLEMAKQMFAGKAV